MLQIRSSADNGRMSYAMWFALGTAYALHSLYMKPDMTVTDHERAGENGDVGKRTAHVVKLRTKDLAEFDALHWHSVVKKQLEPMGYKVTLEVQHLVIEWAPSQVGKLYAVVE
jgi:hypothetical protein